MVLANFNSWINSGGCTFSSIMCPMMAGIELHNGKTWDRIPWEFIPWALIACSWKGAKGLVDTERTLRRQWYGFIFVFAIEGKAADCPTTTSEVDLAFSLDELPCPPLLPKPSLCPQSPQTQLLVMFLRPLVFFLSFFVVVGTTAVTATSSPFSLSFSRATVAPVWICFSACSSAVASFLGSLRYHG